MLDVVQTPLLCTKGRKIRWYLKLDNIVSVPWETDQPWKLQVVFSMPMLLSLRSKLNFYKLNNGFRRWKKFLIVTSNVSRHDVSGEFGLLLEIKWFVTSQPQCFLLLFSWLFFVSRKDRIRGRHCRFGRLVGLMERKRDTAVLFLFSGRSFFFLRAAFTVTFDETFAEMTNG